MKAQKSGADSSVFGVGILITHDAAPNMTAMTILQQPRKQNAKSNNSALQPQKLHTVTKTTNIQQTLNPPSDTN